MSKLKIHLAQINPTVGDLDGNAVKILREFSKANEAGCDLVVFSEMTICGYPCEDLWLKKYFVESAQDKISEIIAATKGQKCAILLGAPTTGLNRAKKEITHNSAILIADGMIEKIIHKKTLPNFAVFDEARYFEAATYLSVIEFRGFDLAILICEDLWHLKNLYLLQEQVFDAVISINASPYSTKKHLARAKICENFAKSLGKPLVYVNQVGGQDSLVFDGSSFVLDSEGKEVLRLAGFHEDCGTVEIAKDGKVTAENKSEKIDETARDYAAVTLGLRDYVQKNGFKKVLLGMSGGIDSALVAAIAVDAVGAENVSLYALPSRFNSETSMVDALECAKNLGLKLEVIPIEESFKAMLTTLGEVSNLTKENLQSRIRGNILMALSNNSGALLLSTGNKSELACGYATLYGDMCGAFNPIKDFYKTRVYELAKFCGKIPQNILTKAPTAELRENQKDSDSLPEYEILDQILFALIEEQKSTAAIISAGFEEELVKKVAKLFYSSEYKRRQSCLGPKVSEMAFDKDRRFPITNKFIN
ncbi:MAG: NAD+ synthase [Rickettsiales bacterium]|nr:NAD+ synthase [Rickettsiales bacterium]